MIKPFINELPNINTPYQLYSAGVNVLGIEMRISHSKSIRKYGAYFIVDIRYRMHEEITWRYVEPSSKLYIRI